MRPGSSIINYLADISDNNRILKKKTCFKPCPEVLESGHAKVKPLEHRNNG